MDSNDRGVITRQTLSRRADTQGTEDFKSLCSGTSLNFVRFKWQRDAK